MSEHVLRPMRLSWLRVPKLWGSCDQGNDNDNILVSLQLVVTLIPEELGEKEHLRSVCFTLLEYPKLYFKQVKEDQVKQMDIENSFITKWKDTQVSSKS